MKLIITILLLGFFTNTLVAEDYYVYYKGINKAKKALINDSLELAENYYYLTFESFDFVYARDCFNALEVSTQLKHFDKIDYFMKRCLKQGVEFKNLEQQEMLSEYKKTSLWSEFILMKDSLRNIYENNVNWEIRNEINEMFKKDQEIRGKYYKAFFKRIKIGREWEALK